MNLLKAVELCKPFTAGKADSRSVLGTVAYQGGRVVATDGKVMAVATVDPSSQEERCLEAGSARVLENYPQWRRLDLSPNQLCSAVHLDRDQMVPALSYLIAAQKAWVKTQGRAVKADINRTPFITKVTSDGNRVTLTLEKPDVSVTLWAAGGDPKFTEISFNAEYLLRCCKAMPDASITLATQGSARQAAVVHCAEKFEEFRVIIMPVLTRVVEEEV